MAKNGAVEHTLPANVPLFEQVRTPHSYQVPLTGRAAHGVFPGAAHVTGMNFGRPGTVSTCVGCHAGHTLIPVPTDPLAAQWTNFATSATVRVSSAHPSLANFESLIDRRVQRTVPSYATWRSAPGQDPTRQWVELSLAAPLCVRTVRLYNLPARPDVDLQVMRATVRLYQDRAATIPVANTTAGPLTAAGTDVAFADVIARAVRVEFDQVRGRYEYEGTVASLAEIEVIARAEGHAEVIATPPRTAIGQ